MKALFATFLLILAVISSAAGADDAARQAVERLLGHLGGAPQWAEARGAYIYEVHVSRWARLPYTHQVWIDFERPRVLVRVENQDLRQLRAMNLSEGWWIQEGKIEPYSADFMADELKRWLASTYRVLHLAAAGDSRLTYSMRDPAILEFSLEGMVVLRMTLDEDGGPVSYARFNNDFGSETVLGPIEAYGDVALWKLVRTPDSSLVSHNLQFRLLPEGPKISFEPPADLGNIER